MNQHTKMVLYTLNTGPSPIGKIPEEFAGGISILDEDPKFYMLT